MTKTFVFLLFLWIVGCSESAWGQTNEAVIRWLSKISYVAFWNRHLQFQSVDWDAWEKEGKEIRNAEQTLCRLLQDDNPDVELPLVAYALGQVGSRESVPILMEALTHSDVHVRLQSAIALGCLRDKRAIPAFANLLEVETDENVRINAVLAVADIGGSESIEVLKMALNDKSGFVSSIARDALGVMRVKGTDSMKEQPSHEIWELRGQTP